MRKRLWLCFGAGAALLTVLAIASWVTTFYHGDGFVPSGARVIQVRGPNGEPVADVLLRITVAGGPPSHRLFCHYTGLGSIASDET